MDLQKYSKALVPLVVMVVLGLLAQTGATPDMTLQDFVTLVLTSGLVWLVPNKA